MITPKINDQYDQTMAETLGDACFEGNIETVHEIIKRGISIDDEAFFAAVSGGHIPVVKLLLSSGIDVNIKNGEAMALAVCHKNWSMVEFLLDSGIDRHAHNDLVFVFAIWDNNVPMVERLLSMGDYSDKMKRRLIRESKKKDRTEIVELLSE